jgi:hypothetical protein
MLVDALVPFSTTHEVVQATYSFGIPHTHVCVTLDKFTTVICLFSSILKYNVVMFLHVMVSYGDKPCPLGMEKSPLS